MYLTMNIWSELQGWFQKQAILYMVVKVHLEMRQFCLKDINFVLDKELCF